MSKYIAILGTETDVGKITVTAGIAKALNTLGATFSVIKPIQTGCVLHSNGDVVAPDIEVMREACSSVTREAFYLILYSCLMRYYRNLVTINNDIVSL